MKDYNELIQDWKGKYNKNLTVKIYDLKTRKEISLHGFYFITNSIIDIIKEYCDYFIIAGDEERKIRITLIINKTEREG